MRSPDRVRDRDVYVVPFSHLDLYWAGTREECLSRGNRIITRAVQLAGRRSEFRFVIEDGVFAANYVEARRGTPEVAELKRLVKEGRIEIAPKWAAIYQNLSRGEAHVRNQIYGKRTAREVFGVDPQVAHLGDLPGYTQQFPQILARSGTPFMVMTRMGPPDCSFFRWRSPDGSRTLVWNAIKSYAWGVRLGLHLDLDEAGLERVAQELEQVRATTNGPVLLGWGTDLWSPSEKLADNVALLNERLSPLRFCLATLDEFFREASQTPDVPEACGEIPSSWANIISSMSHLWPPVMAAADALVTAEKFAAINFALGYADYPRQEFERLWKCALEAMDHNNFGQGGDAGDTRKIGYAHTAALCSGEILRQRLRNIAERVRLPFARCAPIVVFNPLSWARDDGVRAHVSIYGDVSPGDIADYRQAMRLVDEAGVSVPFHVEQAGRTISQGLELAFTARDVPSLGYRTYFLVPAEAPDAFPNTCEVERDDADPARPKRLIGADQFEQEYYRLSVDRATGRLTLFDKELDRVVAHEMEIVGTEMRGGNTLSMEPATGRTVVNTMRAVEIEENNPVRTILRIEGDLGGIRVVQRVFLYRGIRRVDLENTVHWRPGRFMRIDQLFPYGQPEARIRYGIPFGSADGSDILPNSGPHQGDEVPREIWKGWRQIQDWIWAGTDEWGLTIAADRPLMILDEGAVRAGMLRGTFQATTLERGGQPFLLPVPPAGTYVFRYSVSSGTGDWAAVRSYRAGMAFSTPLIPVAVADELSTKSLPPTHSFCSLDAGNLVVTALKIGERDDAVVLRVFEAEGAGASTPVVFLGERQRFRPANLLEEGREEAEETLHLQPYEISTVKLLPRDPG